MMERRSFFSRVFGAVLAGLAAPFLPKTDDLRALIEALPEPPPFRQRQGGDAA